MQEILDVRAGEHQVLQILGHAGRGYFVRRLGHEGPVPDCPAATVRKVPEGNPKGGTACCSTAASSLPLPVTFRGFPARDVAATRAEYAAQWEQVLDTAGQRADTRILD